MTGLEHLAVLAAGLGAGVLTSTVGVASLLSFPVLVAVGLPPVVANASNTVGLTPGGLSGSFGYRRELREHPRIALAVLLACAAGAVAGAVLLLALPPGVFGAVVPWLVLFTSVLVGVQPLISRRVRARLGDDAPDRVQMSRTTLALTVLTGTYGGYFGAGSGVMMVAVLGFGLDLELRVVNGLKTLAVLAANVVATRHLRRGRRPGLDRDRAARGRLAGRWVRRRPRRSAPAGRPVPHPGGAGGRDRLRAAGLESTAGPEGLAPSPAATTRPARRAGRVL